MEQTKIRFVTLTFFLLLGTSYSIAKDTILIGTLSSFKKPEKLGEVFKDNDTDGFDDIESHIRQGAHLFFRKYCPADVLIKDYDTENSTQGTLKAIEAAERDGAKILVGFVSSGPILTVNKVLPHRRIPIITLMATHNDVAQREPPTLQLSYDEKVQGAILAQTILRIPERYKKAVLLLTEATNPFSVGLSKEIKNKLRGGPITLKEFQYAVPLKWIPKQWDLDAFRSATAIVMTSEGREVLEVVSNVSKFNQNYLLIGGDGWYRGNVSQYLPSGVFLPDTVTLGHWTWRFPDKDSQAFRKAYKEKFHFDPGGTAGLAHDAIKTICHVWKKTKKTLSFDSFVGAKVEGLTGTILFNKNGKQDLKRPIVYWFSEGKYVDEHN